LISHGISDFIFALFLSALEIGLATHRLDADAGPNLGHLLMIRIVIVWPRYGHASRCQHATVTTHSTRLAAAPMKVALLDAPLPPFLLQPIPLIQNYVSCIAISCSFAFLFISYFFVAFPQKCEVGDSVSTSESFLSGERS